LSASVFGFASGKVEHEMTHEIGKGLIRWTGIGLIALVAAGAALSQRTVGPVERGSIYMTPRQKDWSKMGIYVGSPKAVAEFRSMRPDAIKVAHGRFQHFCPRDERAWAIFPYSELKAFEAEEVAAGRDPIFVTATYEGKKRPVYFKWSLGTLREDKPTAPEEQWRQAVNVQDNRYIRFWIEQYAQKLRKPDIPNVWIGSDECAFIYSLYGVIDDEGKFVPNVKWDRPFPQDEEAFLTGIKAFFRKLKQTAPEIKVMCNLGSLKDWRRFPEIYADVPGIMSEDITTFLNAEASSSVRAKAYQLLQWFVWAAEVKKVVLLRAQLAQNSEELVRTALMTYLLTRGENFFFAPQGLQAKDIVDMGQVTAMQSALGKPAGTMQSTKEANTSGEGYRLYSRRCRNGIVYLNLTGKTKTIPLPEDGTYYNHSGQRVREITLDDLTGDYALTRPTE
jgi:hypothetical protein